MSFAMSAAPVGWLPCDGSVISRTTYAPLFSAVGTTFGAGDGSTTFRVPDLRGEFVRGWTAGGVVDTGRVFGSFQGDAIRNITGTLGWHVWASTATGVFANSGGERRAGTAVDDRAGLYDVDMDISRQVPTANENRPRNIALLYCIKF
jgi:microcystin-dependent protein